MTQKEHSAPAFIYSEFSLVRLSPLQIWSFIKSFYRDKVHVSPNEAHRLQWNQRQ